MIKLSLIIRHNFKAKISIEVIRFIEQNNFLYIIVSF